MSKRFGRNQKRKLKAEIAELENKNGWLKHEVRSLSSKGAENQSVVDDLLRIMPKFSGLLPAQTIQGEGGMRQSSIELMCHPTFPRGSHPGKVTEAKGYVHQLRLIKHSLEFEQINRLLRVYVSVPQGEGSHFSLAISDELLAVIPEDSLADNIARTIAPSIFGLFKSGRIRRKV